MAKSPKYKYPKGKTNEWVRTGGAIGDSSMEEFNDFNANHAGVDPENVTSIESQGGDPNMGVSLKQKSGRLS